MAGFLWSKCIFQSEHLLVSVLLYGPPGAGKTTWLLPLCKHQSFHCIKLYLTPKGMVGFLRTAAGCIYCYTQNLDLAHRLEFSTKSTFLTS